MILGRKDVAKMVEPTELCYVAYNQKTGELEGYGKGIFSCKDGILSRFDIKVIEGEIMNVYTSYPFDESFAKEKIRVFKSEDELLIVSNRFEIGKMALLISKIAYGADKCKQLGYLIGKEPPFET